MPALLGQSELQGQSLGDSASLLQTASKFHMQNVMRPKNQLKCSVHAEEGDGNLGLRFQGDEEDLQT